GGGGLAWARLKWSSCRLRRVASASAIRPSRNFIGAARRASRTGRIAPSTTGRRRNSLKQRSEAMALSLKQVALVCAAVSSVTRQPSANPRLVAEVLREWDETASDEVEDDAWEGPIRAWLGRAGKESVTSSEILRDALENA